MRMITMTGRLTADPELKKYDKEEKEIQRLTFSIANNDAGKDNPEFFDVVCWGSIAEWGNQYLKKGSRILLVGTPRMDSYESKVDGKKRNHFKITGERLEFLA